MPTLLDAKQSVIDAIDTKAKSTAATSSDVLYLAKSIQSLGEANLNDAGMLVEKIMTMTAQQFNTWLIDVSNQPVFAKLMENQAAVSTLATSSTTLTAIVGNSTAMSVIASNSSAVALFLANNTILAAIVATGAAMTALAGNSVAMTALIGSSSALAAVFASSTALTAIAASSTAMSVILASPGTIEKFYANTAALDALFTSTVAKAAIWNSDVGIRGLQATPTAIQRLIDTSRATYGSYSSSSYVFTSQGTKTILLRRWYNSGEYDYISWNRTNGNAADPNGTTYYGNWGYERNVNYGSTGNYATSNNQNANLVLALNGFQRATWSQGYVMYAYWIVV